jgi:hypothetical protein
LPRKKVQGYWILSRKQRWQPAFFWASGRDNSGGSCAVAWNEVSRPTKLGGLGVLDIKRMGWALTAS